MYHEALRPADLWQPKRIDVTTSLMSVMTKVIRFEASLRHRCDAANHCRLKQAVSKLVDKTRELED